MSVYKGNAISLSIFGQSHSSHIGAVLEGVPAGHRIDMEQLRAFMRRRAAKKEAYSTARLEADEPEIVSGVVDDVTCGGAICVIIKNGDVRSKDYDELRFIPRPGHADFAAYMKYGAARDHRGGGQFSGRMTAALCAAGGILIQLLAEREISIGAHIYELGGIKDAEIDSVSGSREALERLKTADFPALSADKAEAMRSLIAETKNAGDSLGGIIECVANGLPAGLGGEIFDGLEGKLAQTVFAVPAVKGIEFGAGFEAARMKGSENNDPFVSENGKIRTLTNNHGGILGGISSGMPLVFRAAVKPTPSISLEQESVRLDTGEKVKFTVKGRHDACIVPRAVPCIEAAAALAIYDELRCHEK